MREYSVQGDCLKGKRGSVVGEDDLMHECSSEDYLMREYGSEDNLMRECSSEEYVMREYSLEDYLMREYSSEDYLMREYSSETRFCRGVPDNAQRYLASRAKTALAVLQDRSLMLCAYTSHTTGSV